MTTTPSPSPGYVPTFDDPYDGWLFSIVQSLYVVQAGAIAPRDRDPDAQPDVAAALAAVTARLAADVGSVDALLAGNPAGSGQADLVRQLVASATPPDGLLPLRTRAVRLTVDTSAEFLTFGLTQRFTDEYEAVCRAIGTAQTEIEADDARTLAGEMNAIWEADKAAWMDDLAKTARAILAARGLPETVPVDVVDVGPAAELEHDALATEVFELAFDRTAIPRAAEPEAWADPADATYTARARRVLAAREQAAAQNQEPR
ncbi:hypothetical protein [Promicromonospora sp. NFX87]|uniref:hypothetical protein n=1 Tax=Promicromonospora sp. NFX87 TaxID=3402691 RepID=UPI003AFB66D8